MGQPDFWADNIAAQKVSREFTALKKGVETWEKLEAEIADLEGLVNLAEKEPDKALESDLEAKFEHLNQVFEEVRLTTLLGGKYDNHSAILSIHAGAGGTDAQDWAEMLLRMYL